MGADQVQTLEGGMSVADVIELQSDVWILPLSLAPVWRVQRGQY